MEHVSPEGLRVDGRRPGEVRRVRCQLGVLEQADGSALLEQGNTNVIAAVYGPRECANRVDALQDRAIINVELSNASFAQGERRGKIKTDRKANEVAALVREAFEVAVLVHLYPNSQIDIFLQIVQVDGGRTAAAINAANLALIDAGIPLRDFVCCCHAGYIGNTAIIDLNYAEECSNCPDMPLAILPNCGDLQPVNEGKAGGDFPSLAGGAQEMIVGDGEAEDAAALYSAGGVSGAEGNCQGESVVMMQLERRLPLDLFEEVMAAAADGARQIYTLLHEEVRQHTLRLLESRGALAL